MFLRITTESYCAASPRRESGCAPPLPRGGGGPISVKIGPPPPRGRGGTHTHFRDAATLGSSGRGRHTYRSNPPDRQRGEPLTEASSSGAQRHNTVQPHKGLAAQEDRVTAWPPAPAGSVPSRMCSVPTFVEREEREAGWRT